LDSFPRHTRVSCDALSFSKLSRPLLFIRRLLVTLPDTFSPHGGFFFRHPYPLAVVLSFVPERMLLCRTPSASLGAFRCSPLPISQPRCSSPSVLLRPLVSPLPSLLRCLSFCSICSCFTSGNCFIASLLRLDEEALSPAAL
jgi:hypothetical protein